MRRREEERGIRSERVMRGEKQGETEEGRKERALLCRKIA